ncbi:hypothetical protein CR513_41290, partial [Mucuna pruriens]
MAKNEMKSTGIVIMNNCLKHSNNVVYSCITDCASTKSTNVNIDARDLAPYTMDSCLKECQKKK